MTQNFFLLLLLFLACKGVSQDVHIRVNLIGYEASHPKKALILSKTPINDAWFIFQENGKKVKEINPILLKGENWAPFDYYWIQSLYQRSMSSARWKKFLRKQTRFLLR